MAFLAEDRLPLLSLGDNEENSLSGYDSPVFTSDAESELLSPGKSSEYSSTVSASETDISSDDDDGDDLDDLEELDDTVHMTSTDILISNMKYILKMPELCDVTFHVGPQLHQVHGLKAVVGSRSKVLQDKILQQHNQQRLRKSKKNENRCSYVNIFINNYDIEVFSKFIDFLHTGSIVMDVTTVVGLTCAAVEFHVPDLKTACFGYLKRCATTASNITILRSEIDNYDSNKATDEIKTLLSKMTNNRSGSPCRKETAV